MNISKKQSHQAQEIARHPDVVERVKQEAREKEIIPTSYEVLKEIQRGKIEKQREERLTNIASPLPENKYRTIIIDPPWPMEKILRDVRPNQDSFDYPTMSIDEIKAFPLSDIAYADGCHVYLWTTHKFLPVSFEIFQAWDVKYECLLTWVKNVGFTPFSFMYSTEHVLFGRIGSLELLKKGERLDFNAKVEGHSVKPEIFYDLIRRVSPEPRIDIFARKKHERFDVYGNQVELRT